MGKQSSRRPGDHLERDVLTTKLSAGRRLVFTAAALLLPFLVLIAIEASLRLSGYGDATPLFTPVETHPDFQYQHRDVARRYFRNLTSLPSSQLDFFRIEKEPQTFRIFVQGGSTAAGFPFYYGASFSRVLQARLRAAYPERKFEVINTAMSAVNSYTLHDLAPEIIREKPDAVLIYAGHNEYYGALGVASVESLGRFPALVRLYLTLDDLRIVQALRGGIASLTGALQRDGAQSEEGQTLMARVVAEQNVPHGSKLFQAGIRQFESNVCATLRRYQAERIPVFISTIASNERDQPPFVDVLPEHVPAERLKDELRTLRQAAADDPQAALRHADSLIAIIPGAASLHFQRARILESTSPDEAAAAYRNARDLDALRFRAPSDMNDIIRSCAAQTGAIVVDSYGRLAAESAVGVVGEAYMTEHLHPNPAGYRVISDAFFEALTRTLEFGSPAAGAPTPSSFTDVDSLAGIFRIRQLTSGWPFRPAGSPIDWKSGLDLSSPAARLAMEVFEQRTEWLDATREIRAQYVQTGDLKRALTASHAIAEQYPMLAQSHLDLGLIQMEMGDYAAAGRSLRASLERRETARARAMLGSILLNDGRRDEAIPHLQRAVELEPQNVQAIYNLSGALALDGRYDDARRMLDRLFRVAPEHPDGRRLLASLPTDR